MKITIKKQLLTQPMLLEELGKFAEHDFKIATALKVKSVYDELEKKIIDMDKERYDLYKAYSVLDENGNFVHPTDESGKVDTSRTTLIEESRPEFEQKMMDLMNSDITLESEKVKLSELDKDIKMSVKTLSILNFMIDVDIA